MLAVEQPSAKPLACVQIEGPLVPAPGRHRFPWGGDGRVWAPGAARGPGAGGRGRRAHAGRRSAPSGGARGAPLSAWAAARGPRQKERVSERGRAPRSPLPAPRRPRVAAPAPPSMEPGLPGTPDSAPRCR